MKAALDLIVRRGEESAQVQSRFCRESAPLILQAAKELSRILKEGGKILAAGNGGSAADAQHFAGELINRFLMERRPLPGLALSTDTSVLTAIANDYSYDQIFSKQVEALGSPGDALLAISTSGGSPSVLRALERANAKSILTVGLTGRDGGGMPPLCDICLVVPSSSTPRVQETHHLVLHILCELIEQALFGDRNG